MNKVFGGLTSAYQTGQLINFIWYLEFIILVDNFQKKKNTLVKQSENQKKKASLSFHLLILDGQTGLLSFLIFWLFT